MTLREYITVLKKSVGDVNVVTTAVDELNIITVEDKINSFDSKIIISDTPISAVKYTLGADNVTIIASIKIPKYSKESFKWAGIVKLSLAEDNNITVNLHIISIGEEAIDLESIMDNKLNTFIKI